MQRIYVRCNGGHYFMGLHCPFDGWTSVEAKEIAEVAETLGGRENLASISSLRAFGVSESALQRVMIAEFGNPHSAFEAVSPESYIVNGQTIDPTNWGRDFI